ncbi:MAG: family 10 glycosylhydrolase [Verrucomicrobiae bacterium]|nr:family 10 glycosylhydrolase [Verrucomicrobiae bacterium]
MSWPLNLAAAALLSAGAVIDDCRYAHERDAQARWVPMKGTAQVSITNVAGESVLRLPCNFAGNPVERASWDRKVQLDLTTCRGIQFRLWCPDLSPVARFTLYFGSGDGWYVAGFSPEKTNTWNVVTIDKAQTSTEGKPAGWGQITTIRISAWRGKDADTELLLADLRTADALGDDTTVAVIRAESAVRRSPDEMQGIVHYTETVTEHLAALGIRYALVSDLDVTAERLKLASLVVLPHNPWMPENAVDELVNYIKNGGKLLAFYSVPAKLRDLLGLQGGEHVRAKYTGNFSTIRFHAGALPGAPKLVGQRSWNIHAFRPADGGCRVLADWLDAAGQPTGYAAVLGSTNGLVMTHVLLSDDPLNKQRMLLAMVGYLVPEVWRKAVDARIARIGPLTVAATTEQEAQAIEAARKARELAVKLAADGKFPEAMDAAITAQRHAQRAFCLAKRPEPGEFRAFWCHSAFGVEGMEWDEAIRRLAQNGFTAILPNMLWGGVAFYESKVLPVAKQVSERGDQIAKCLAAAKKYGIQVHVWKVNWNLGQYASAAFAEKMRAQKRLQVSLRGKEEPWLCPSHPENQKLEIEAMVEVARNYDVDGIHFDYIRYPGSDHCFCEGCRERFEQAVGMALPAWPKDVLAGGPLRQKWLDWRRSNIDTVVRAVSEQARAIKPKIKISAAVFRQWNTDRDTVGQDWKLWCDNGWLDFVCPMNYTASNATFENWVAQQVQWAGRAGCYPGIGVSASRSRLTVEQVIEQIKITRKHRTGGFVLFNYGVAESRELLPLLGLGITAPAK